MSFSEQDLNQALDTLEGLRYWLDGGWGIEALLASAPREHRDLDLVIRDEDLDVGIERLSALGYRVFEDHRPTRCVLRDEGGRQIDFHPVQFDERGQARQIGAGADGGDAIYPRDSFTTGDIGGRRVPCLSAELQLKHHTGYEPDSYDYEDIGRLHKEFPQIDLPEPYASRWSS